MKQLQGIISFIETADAGSMAAAARRLDVTPAAVSKNLLRLEAQLGVRLLQRNTRGMRLTDEGRLFLENARTALQGLDDAVAQVTQSAEEPVGRVRISVGVSFGRSWLLAALPPLTQAYPQLQIEVDLDNRPADLVAEGYDIGIRGGAPAHASLISRRLCGLPVALIASPDYLKRAGVPTRPEELARHQCIQRRKSDGSLSRWRFTEPSSGQRYELEPSASLMVNESEAMVDLVLAGAGIAQAGLYSTLPWLRSGELKLVLTEVHDAGTREFQLHYPDRKFLAPRVRVVVDALLAFFKDTNDLYVRIEDLPTAFKAAAPLSAS